MLAFLLANTPAWVIDGKNYLGFFASFVAALALVWRYAIKPYLVHREAERKRDLCEAAQLRQGEIRVALIPMEETMRLVQADMKRTGDKMILQGDAIHGINVQLRALALEQKSLHADVRDHMRTEEQR